MDKFDIGWFMTIPGALISAGVVCLLIAIIVIIFSISRDKKEKKLLEAENNQVSTDMNNSGSVPPVQADVNNQVAAAPVASTPAVVEQTPVAVEQAPVAPVAPVEVAPQVETIPVSTEMVQAPVVPVESAVEVAPIAQAVEMPVTVEAPMIDVQPVEVMPAAEEVAAPVSNGFVPESVPAVEVMSVEAPVVEMPVPVEAQTVEMPVTVEAPMIDVQPVEVMQAVESTPVEVMQPVEVQTTPEVQPVIYGGASLGVSNLDLNQNTTHQIYGGANPLENTQSMPIMNDFNQVPTAPVEVAQPMMEAVPTAPTEVVQTVDMQPVASTPVMEPIA